jgi:hypothetical protein
MNFTELMEDLLTVGVSTDKSFQISEQIEDYTS